jgi:hypothetical protein
MGLLGESHERVREGGPLMFRYLIAAATGCVTAVFVVACVLADAAVGATSPHNPRKHITCTRTPQRKL